LIVPRLSGADFPPNDEIVARIKPVVDKGRAKGIVVGVLESDGSTRVIAYGDGGPDTRPLGAKSMFEIGSVTKLFTATILADMVARGEVSLSDPVSKYLPEDVTVPARGGRQITLLDLATHHSGLPRTPDNHAPAVAGDKYADYTLDKLYAFLAAHQLRRDAGAEFEYSNAGFGLLGHALARAAGTTYGDLARKRILEPLGMKMTARPLAEWMTKGYDEKVQLTPYWNATEAYAGAGALRSNAEEMLKFLAAGIGPHSSPLRRAMHETQKKQRDINNGMGMGLAWYVRPFRGRTTLVHTGSTGGYASFVGIDPEKRIAIVILTNTKTDDLRVLGSDLLTPKVE
jgi:CubicO group peptidase (beta-lactamase class C family)